MPSSKNIKSLCGIVGLFAASTGITLLLLNRSFDIGRKYNNHSSNTPETQPEKNYGVVVPGNPRPFAEVDFGSAYSTQHGLSITTADVDGDGDQDIIVGVPYKNTKIRLYIFKNDGKGHFSQ